MQLLLTTSSLREQQATVVLIKTGIQGRTIYRVTTQTHTCIQKQIFFFFNSNAVYPRYECCMHGTDIPLFYFALEIY